MDDIGEWNHYLQSQIKGLVPVERELLMTLQVPLVAGQEHFRVGWDIKRPTGHRYVAISTGRAMWSRGDLGRAAEHIWTLLSFANEMMEPIQRDLDR